jgi:hypothetical protein
MAFDHNVGGHAFTERGGRCLRCEMSWAKFMDSKQPRCTGQKPEQPRSVPIEDYDDEF